jgi:hypothetical protein
MDFLIKEGYNVKEGDINSVVDVELRCKSYTFTKESNHLRALENVIKQLKSKRMKTRFWKEI